MILRCVCIVIVIADDGVVAAVVVAAATIFVARDYAYVLLNFQFDSKIQSEKTEMKALTMECDSQNNWNILGMACHHFCVATSTKTTKLTATTTAPPCALYIVQR